MSRRSLAAQVDRETAAAIGHVLADPVLEIVPLKGISEKTVALPPGAWVAITNSPRFGMERTIGLAEELAGLGFRVIPHLSAATTEDGGHLAEVMDRLRDAAVDDVFVIGGDRDPIGPYPDALALLEAIAELGHRFGTVGIAGYPEGHPIIPDRALAEALVAKERHATYVVTQMCFDVDAVTSWIGALRRDGIRLPVQIGLPGSVVMHKLARIATQVGVGDSLRFLAKQKGLFGALVRPGGYVPDELLVDLAPAIADPEVGILGLHLYTFNQVEATVGWRAELMEALGLSER